MDTHIAAYADTHIAMHYYYVCILCYLCYRSSDPLKAKGYADAAVHSVNNALAAHYPNCKYLH
jgi:hypothetical protein